MEFVGHEAKIFNVIFNSSIPNIFATGSDDLTVRIWDIDKGHQRALKGHSKNVRAIIFNPELPWCILSGSWDATIKLWDARSG